MNEGALGNFELGDDTRVHQHLIGSNRQPGHRAAHGEERGPVDIEVIDLGNVGLGYLTLDRSAATLSGGEGQRIRLATQIGSRLTGVL